MVIVSLLTTRDITCKSRVQKTHIQGQLEGILSVGAALEIVVGDVRGEVVAPLHGPLQPGRRLVAQVCTATPFTNLGYRDIHSIVKYDSSTPPLTSQGRG
jgi:hypothetical protein